MEAEIQGQFARRAAETASSTAFRSAITQAVARGGAGAFARAALGRTAAAIPVVGQGIAVASIAAGTTRLVLDNTAAGRRLDNWVYNQILRHTPMKPPPIDPALNDKLVEFALRRLEDPMLDRKYHVSEDGNVVKRNAFDPNIRIGPAGFGPENWTRGGIPLPYLVRFENLATAGAAAAEVTIVTQLDPDLDPATFELGDIGWADVIVNVPPGLKAFRQRVDFQQATGLFVDVDGWFDPNTVTVTWRIKAIDPLTEELPGPDSPSEGFLLPNDASDRGEGFVSYRVRPRAQSATGTVIDARANIVFDLNAAIPTEPIFNTLDVDSPSSEVDMLATTTAAGDIHLMWSAADIGSGIARYDVYAAVDGGPFTLFLDDTTMTSALYRGGDGHDYGFYVVAFDNVGHEEAAPARADTTTRVVLGGVTPTASATPVASPTPIVCLGDCSGDGEVTVDEVVRGVTIALGTTSIDECSRFDRDGNRAVTIEELVAAVKHALVGC